MSDWQVGMASAPFEVPPGTAMGGYADRTGPSVGTSREYPLTVTALTLASGSDAITIVGADVIGVDTRLRGEVAALAGILAESLLIGATHTHSGPEGVLDRLHPAGHRTGDPTLRARFVAEVAGTVGASQNNRSPARLTMHEATCPGLWSNRNDPDGPTDPRVRILAIDLIEDGAKALVIVLPTHPTILDASNRVVAADLPGGVRRALNAMLGWENVPILILTGAAGDSSTRRTRQASTFDEVARIGRAVAVGIVTALGAPGVEIPPNIGHRVTEVALPMRSFDHSAAESELADARSHLAALEGDLTSSEADRRSAHTRVQGAELQLLMGGLAPVTMPLEAWRLGDRLDLVAVPGELFTSLASRLEADAERATWVIGYANGYLGYLPDAAAYAAPRYEALASPYAPAVGDRVVEAMQEVLAGLD